jgi:hypothetical protein
MVWQSNQSIQVSNLNDAVFSHWVFADVMKLINSSSSEEDIDSDDDEEFWYDTKFISAMQLTVVHSSHYLFCMVHHGDVRQVFYAANSCEWEKIVFGNRYNDDEFLQLFCVLKAPFYSIG